MPPAKPIIYDAKRRDMSKLFEAYPEGADLFLVCEVHGGKLIKLKYYREQRRRKKDDDLICNRDEKK